MKTPVSILTIIYYYIQMAEKLFQNHLLYLGAVPESHSRQFDFVVLLFVIVGKEHVTDIINYESALLRRRSNPCRCECQTFYCQKKKSHISMSPV